MRGTVMPDPQPVPRLVGKKKPSAWGCHGGFTRRIGSHQLGAITEEPLDCRTVTLILNHVAFGPEISLTSSNPLAAIAALTFGKSNWVLSAENSTLLVWTLALMVSFSTNCRVESASRTLAVQPEGQVIPGTSRTI